MVRLVPRITLLAAIEGFRALGFDVDALVREAEIDATRGVDDSPLPFAHMEKLWMAALGRAPREELPIEVGLSVPRGVYGAIDYLAETADTLGGALQALGDHFANVDYGGQIEVAETDDAYRVAYVQPREGFGGFVALDYLFGLLVNRLRAIAVEFPIVSIELTRPVPSRPDRFEALLGAPVSFERATGTMHLRAHAPSIPLKTRDPRLHQTLESLASGLSLGEGGSSLDRAIRSRLRDLLPKGEATAPRVARSLGMSERSLHRRLAQGERSFRDLVDTFRRAEAERLLGARRLGIAEVAQALGFADQSAFTRAFRRWTNMTPSVWVTRHKK